MPKDRLAEFKEKSRGGGNDVQSEDGSAEVRLLVDPENDAIGQLQAEVDAIRREIGVIERSLTLLKQKQDDTVFKRGSDEQNKLELTEITDNINKIARSLKRKLKLMAARVTEDDQNPFRGNLEENRIRKIQYMTVTKKYSEVMQAYLELQEEYRDKCKKNVLRQFQAVNPNLTAEDIEKMEENDDIAVFTGDELNQVVIAKQNLDDANALKDHLKKIEQGIIEIHELFKDLNLLVNQQGEALDRIQDYVESVKVSTDKGLKELIVAKNKKVQARKCRLVCLGVVVVVVVVLIAVLVAVYGK